MELGILKNEFGDCYANWAIACDKLGISYKVIDLTSVNWLDQVVSSGASGFLACPSGRESIFKNLYDERISIIARQLNKFVYPDYEAISIHENKKYLSYWLRAKGLPMPETRVFYNKVEALDFVGNFELPVVGKINIGASGRGVKILRSHGELTSYINAAFSEGLRQYWGPNLKMGGTKTRILNVLKNPELVLKKLKNYRTLYKETQKGFVILQEFIPHDYEWRIVKIGDSYFGHQKVKQGDKASGTKGINFVVPPPELLTFVKNVSEDSGFPTMCYDLFENPQGKGYLINEMQCNFGHVQEYICAKDGKPGRFLYKDRWIFEEGLFNSNLSYDLRLQNMLEILDKAKIS